MVLLLAVTGCSNIACLKPSPIQEPCHTRRLQSVLSFESVFCHIHVIFDCMQEVLSDAGHLDELLRASSSGGSVQGLRPQQQHLLLPNSIPSADGRSAAAVTPADRSFTDAATAAASGSKGDISPSQITVTNADSAAMQQQESEELAKRNSSTRITHCISLAGGVASRGGGKHSKQQQQQQQQQQQDLTEDEAMQLVEDELQQQQQQQQLHVPHEQQVEQQLLQLQQLQEGLRGRSGSGSGGNASAAAAAAAAAALVSGGSSSTLQPQQQAAVDWYITKFYNSFKNKPLGPIGSCRSTEDLEDWATGRPDRSSRADRHSTEDRDKQTSFEEWRAAYASSRPGSAAGNAGPPAAAVAAARGGRFSGVSDSGSGYNRGVRAYDSLDGHASVAISDAEEHPALHDRTTQDTLFEDMGRFGQQQQQQGAGQHQTTQETLLEGDIDHLVQQQQQQQQGQGMHHVAFAQSSGSGSGVVTGGLQAGSSAAGAAEAAASALLEQLKIAEVRLDLAANFGSTLD
jgi:hypothetical protein